MKAISILILCCVVAVSCKKGEKKIPEIAVRDTTITKENSFTELFIDSTTLAHYSQKEKIPDSIGNRMQNFYNQRNHQFAWFFPDGPAEFVATFMSLQDDYIHYSGDSSLNIPD
jgi:hypothetical protein